MDIQKILNKLHITELNEMQQNTVEAILGTDGDVVLLSATGTGKTLAYLLPVAQLIEQECAPPDNEQSSMVNLQSSILNPQSSMLNAHWPLALVITPGRELALQSAGVLRSMGCGLRSMACYGGRAAMDEHRVMRDVRPQIVFGTPGRLNDHLDKGNIDPHNIRFLVIDEFDKCLEMGFHNEMRKLIRSLPGLRRRILLSATNAEQIPEFVNMSRKGTLIDFLPEERQGSGRVTIYEVRSPEKDKLDTLRQLLISLGSESSVVFLNYRDSVERVNSYLSEKGFITSCLHGGMEQRQREDMLYKFSNGSANVLVATDLASRGLDIPDIRNIIHYHLPESEEGYIHRVGRTARWDATGRTFFILHADERLPDYIPGQRQPFLPSPDAHPSPLPPKMATLYIGKGKKDKISKGDIVGFLCKTGGLRADEIGRIDVKDRYAYAAVRRDKVRQVLLLTRGEKIKGVKTLVEEIR